MNLFHLKKADGGPSKLRLETTIPICDWSSSHIFEVCYANASIQGLDLSIKKWEFLVEALQHRVSICSNQTISDGGSMTCALCELYLPRHCEECPIKLHTGERFCQGTPFTKYVRSGTVVRQLQHAEEEVAFLKALKEKEINEG